MKSFFQVVLAWLVAIITTAVIGSIIQTQFSLAAIAAVGAPVPIDVRLAMTMQDLAGFTPALAAITAAGFVVAFGVAALLALAWPRRQVLLYTLAGATALLVAIGLMNAVLPVIAIGATRSVLGLLAFALAGAAGGRVFAALVPLHRVA